MILPALHQIQDITVRVLKPAGLHFAIASNTFVISLLIRQIIMLKVDALLC